jgi:hypothetical protein
MMTGLLTGPLPVFRRGVETAASRFALIAENGEEEHV